MLNEVKLKRYRNITNVSSIPPSVRLALRAAFALACCQNGCVVLASTSLFLFSGWFDLTIFRVVTFVVPDARPRFLDNILLPSWFRCRPLARR